MEKHTIIQLKKQGHSNREIARLTGINRKTIARFWNEFQQQMLAATKSDQDILFIQQSLARAPSYDSSGRQCRKYTKEIDKRLDEILASEKEKEFLLGGSHRQRLTGVQIYNKLKIEGFDIGKTTIVIKIREKRDIAKECFVKQDYEFGDRLEYDFGEVKLLINGIVGAYHMAVFSSPASNFRWAYLYKDQKKGSFMDSHVRFFEMIGGVYKEVVYDNMKNVVSKFIGRNEKELNTDLLLMSNYYGYQINVTNCFSGNEKGHVEGSVKIIRNQVFAERYKFLSLQEAANYLNEQLILLNQGSRIDEERHFLLRAKPKLELGKISLQKVNKYSFVTVEKNFYSVPDYLTEREVTVKSYFDRLCVYSNNCLVCSHKKIEGTNQISIEIMHYLNTLLKKPGSIKNSLALKKSPRLKSIYDNYFVTQPKRFVEILMANRDKNSEEMIAAFSDYTRMPPGTILIDAISSREELAARTKVQTAAYNNLRLKGVM